MVQFTRVCGSRTVCTALHGLYRCERVQVAWLQDRIHGQGVAVFASGNRYEGSWDNGRIHGRGVGPQTHDKDIEDAKYAFSVLHADSNV